MVVLIVGSLMLYQDKTYWTLSSDNIFVINNGKLEDSGTHEELLGKNKYYKKLYNLEISKSS